MHQVLFADEPMNFEAEPALTSMSAADRWKVLIVDDEKDVHDVTILALKRLEFELRGIEFLSAYSAAEGIALLEAHPDIAVVLLDVVMEDDHAGLAMVRKIRENLKNDRVRIILRTGHPGQAPEESVTRDYDINDYREKTELTAKNLRTGLSRWSICSMRWEQNAYTRKPGRGRRFWSSSGPKAVGNLIRSWWSCCLPIVTRYSRYVNNWAMSRMLVLPKCRRNMK